MKVYENRKQRTVRPKEFGSQIRSSYGVPKVLEKVRYTAEFPGLL